MAPRGPRRVLWVVVEITSTCGTGDGWAPPATKPAMWAMSATSTAAGLAGDLAEGGEVDRAGQGGAAAEDHLGPFLEGQLADLVEVDEAGVVADAVLDATEPLAGGGDAPAVGEVAAHRQGHAHDGVAGLGEGEVDGEVGRGAGVGLDVGVLDAEDGLRALDGEGLDLVDVLLTLVVAAAGVALAVLVLEDGAGGFEDGGGDVVLAGNEAQGLRLETFLGTDEGGELGVGGGERGVRVRALRGGHGGVLRASAGPGALRGRRGATRDFGPVTPRRAASRVVCRARLPRGRFPVRQSPCVFSE